MASIQSYILKVFIRRLNLFGSGEINPQKLRDRLEQVATLSKPHRKVQVVTVEADSVPAEWFIPNGVTQDRVLLYIHGGAWFMGSTRLYRGFVSNLAYASCMKAIAINYRLAPEDPFPAGLEDCVTAYEWLLQSGISANKIVIAGDSAGGNLTLALLVALRDAGKPLPAGAVALSPATDLTFTGASTRTHAHLDPFFHNVDSNTIVEDYITDHDPYDPLISPLFADLSGLPTLLIHVGEHEILLDDAVRFGDRARTSGVDVKIVVWPEMFHVFHLFAPILPEARRANDQIVTFIKSRFNHNSST